MEKQFDSEDMTKSLSWLRIVEYVGDIEVLKQAVPTKTTSNGLMYEKDKVIQPIDLRNERAVIFKLIGVCNDHLNKYTRTIAGDK